MNTDLNDLKYGKSWCIKEPANLTFKRLLKKIKKINQ